MLLKFRRLSNNIISKALIAIIVASFMLWGIGDILRPSGTYVAKVGSGHYISYDEFRRVLNYNLQELSSKGVQLEESEQNMLQRLVLNRLINDHLAIKWLQDQRLEIGDELAVRFIKKQPQFTAQNGEGGFDKELYLRLLSEHGLEEHKYIEHIKQQLYMTVFNRIIQHLVTAPESMVKVASSFWYDKFIAKWHQIEAAIVLTMQIPSDSELESYFSEHKEEFAWPEYRSASLLTVYDVDNQELLAQVEDALASGISAYEIAEKFSIKLAKLPLISIAGVDKEGKEVPLPDERLLDYMFSTDVGSDSGLVLSGDQQSYFILIPEEIVPAKSKTFAEAETEVIKLFNQMRREEAEQNFLAQVNQLLAEKGAKETIAQYPGDTKVVTLSRAEEVDGYNPEVKSQLFSLAPGQNTEAVLGERVVEFAELQEIKSRSYTEAQKAKVSEELYIQLQQDIYDHIMASLRKKYKVKTYI